MNDRDDLEQKLWELEYGLLSGEEASTLRERIAGDPELAAVHQRVCAQSAILAEAARIELPRIHLQVTAATTGDGVPPVTQSSKESLTADRNASKRSIDYRPIVNWCIGIAATLLIGLVGFSAVNHGRWELKSMAVVSQEEAEVPAASGDTKDASADELVRISIDGPPAVQPGISNRYEFYTSDRSGVPQSAELQVQVADKEGEVKLNTIVATDARGRGSLVVPAEMGSEAAKMEVAEVTRSKLSLAVPLEKATDTYVTYLTTDRPRYRLGDTVRFRSVTLSKFALQADREMEVAYEITDPTGAAVPESKQSGMTSNGVGNGEFVVTENHAGGQYTLVAQNSANLFPPAHHDFYVQADDPRQWTVDVVWAEDWYAPAAQARAKAVVRSLEGKPAADLPIRAEAYVDGHRVEIPNSPTRTDQRGEAEFTLELPREMESGEGLLQLAPGQEDFQNERIPIRVPRILVDFYPEGGELVSGLKSRIYFHAHDTLGRPVEIRGRILDGNNQEVANLATQHEGRGVFELNPDPSQSYKLAITEPAQVFTDSRLPPVKDEHRIVLHCGKGVFAGNEIVTPRLQSKSPPPDNLTVVAKCRDAMVGHLTVWGSDFVNGECEAPLPLAAEASGVVRITVFEGEQPLAERLIFREPARKLSLQVEGTDRPYAPTSKVQLALTCVAEQGTPAPAVLGIGVVDDAVLNLTRPTSPQMSAYLWLFGDIDSPEKLENANFYVADSVESRTALDLLLGTQGWRRFERVPQTGVALNPYRMQEGYVAADGTQQKLGAAQYGDQLGAFGAGGEILDRTAELPLRVDNSALIEQVEQEQLQQLGERTETQAVPKPRAKTNVVPSARTRTLDLWMTTVGCAIGLMALSLLAVFMRLASSRRLAFMSTAIGAVVLLIAIVSSFRKAGPTPDAMLAAGAPNAELDNGRSSESKTSAAWSMAEQRTGGRVPTEKLATDEPSPTEAPQAAQPAPADPRTLDFRQQADFSPPQTAAGGAGRAAPVPPQPASVPPQAAPANTPVPPMPGMPGMAGAELKAMSGKAMGPVPAKATELGSPQERLRELPLEKQNTASRSIRKLQDSSRPSLELMDGVKQRAEPTRIRRKQEAAELGQELRSHVQLREEGAKSTGPVPSTGTVAEALKKENSNQFFVRRYAHQRSLTRQADKDSGDYTETLYWNPMLITDANGRAEIEFDLSDSATTYRLLIDAHHDGRINSLSKELKVETPKN